MPIRETTVNDAASGLMLMHHKTSREKVSARRSVAANFLSSKTESIKRSLEALEGQPPNIDTQHTKRRRLSRGLNQKKRSVRFAPMVQTHAHKLVEEHEAKQVWWSREEIGHIHRRERSLVKILCRLCPLYVQKLDKIVKIASGEVTGNDDDEDVPMWIAKNQSRGLEIEVLHILGGSPHSPKRVIREVLDTHSQLQEYGDMIGPEELRSQILRAKCERLSRNKVDVAQLLANGDAKVAQME